ncbi:golvesin C-terminal-like domain-containing protein [Butyricimonas paravirosa]|uniref:golvesin C-terminal-like domain-containing protein n=1 Tax=Butyricimonas paravirosa TaxID=1472417 RepID=UPI0021094886|nr:hypothetical protein [Butyricimonas paravirosa]MCQ4872352.1 hypothetical protein [Butyricimonas paravirosa]
METTALKTTIAYESKLVKRNWLFYLFILGILGYTLGVLIPWNINQVLWSDVALASSIPSRSVYFLNLFQSLIVAFIVCDIQRKQRKAETREVLSTRPISNGKFFLGGFLGILIPFLTVDVVFMGITMFINIFIPDSPANLWVNLFYLLTRTLPTLIFITGLSLLVNKLIKHPFISWLILIIFLYFAYSYLTTPLHGMLDFRGSLLPDSFSTLVGFTHIEDNLLQRSTFLLLGISFLFFAAPLTKRLPGTPGRKPYYFIPASLFLVFSLSLGYLYVEKFQTRLKNRIAYREAFLKYNEYPTSRVLSHDITYRPEGDKFSAISRMSIQNQRKVEMDQLLLFLNPGLKINKLESNGQNLPFHRDHQVIVIKRPVAPGENIELEIEYEGYIDEDIYQVNIPDDDFFAPVIYTSYHENYGKRSAFVSDEFTLLVPEVIWYPTAVFPVELQASKEINFTDYTLHVKQTDKMTVLSQGEPMPKGDHITFNNVQNLTGLTLCIGKYEKRSITVDSTTVEFYTYPGNDFYMKPLDTWEGMKAGSPGREKKLAKIANRCKDIIEEGQSTPYPFKYFKLIETPSSFLRGSRFSNNIQPEIAFFEERFSTTDHYKPGAPPRGLSDDINLQEYILYQSMPSYLNLINIDHIFTDHIRHVTSDRYRGIDIIFNQIMSLKGSKSYNIMPQTLNDIAEKGLKESITGEYSLEKNIAISLKVSHLLGYLTTLTSWDTLTRFMQDFKNRTRFQEVNFDSFIDEFEQRFGQNIKAYIDEWYTSHQIPWLSLKELSLKATEEIQIMDFKVGNFSETDGIVSIISRSSTESGKDRIKNYRSYQIKPGECKRIIVHEDRRCGLQLTTNFSGNLPKEIELRCKAYLSSGSLPDEGVSLLEHNQFYPPGEIIVDNEDENFHLIDSANNRKRLTDLFKKGNEDEYITFCNPKVNTWGLPCLPILLNDFYGEYIRSAFIKEAGTGKFKAEWVANIPEAGKYEIFVNRPHAEIFSTDMYTTDHPGMKNYYTVYTPEGKEEVILEVQKGDPSWVSLGTFSLSAGESRVVLDDRGAPPIESQSHSKHSSKYVQLVVADAVKWVKIK